MEKTIEPVDEIYDRVTIIRNAWDEMVQRELKNATPVQQSDPSSEVGTLDLSG
jgi:flagellin-specific chaperone FliS